jgi:UDP-glucose 4-epimerase
MLLALADAGFDVAVFDNLSRGHTDAVGSAPLVVRDLCFESDLERPFEIGAFGLVMLFAALAYVGETFVAPEHYYCNKVAGTLNPLAATRRH